MQPTRLSGPGWSPRLAATGLSAACALALGYGALRKWIARPVPPVRGECSLAGLAADVEVLRDRWGIPHVYAATLADLFLAQGYLVAQDRLWQLETLRRAASGTLAECIGPPGLEMDRFLRRLGLARAAAAESPSGEGGQALEAYVAGVNAWISAPDFRLPVEFSLLRFAPRPWSVADLIAMAKLYAWLLSTNWQTEYIRALLIDRLGAKDAALLEPEYPAGHPISAGPEPGCLGADGFTLAQFLACERFLATGGASNAWAASGARTASGRPLLANDPHLPPQVPSFWYEIHLEAPGFSVIGATVPGVPGVLVGHNRRIAWGITVSMADSQDLYVERIHPTDPGLYQHSGEWRPFDVRAETFVVRRRSGLFSETVAESIHGPVISPLLPDLAHDRRVLTLRCASREPTDADAVLLLNRADGWPEFRASLARWTTGCLNFVYADVEGNVGYQLAGRVPIRARGEGLAPAPGWDGEHEWVGYIPPAELPSSFNPPDGLIVSANNRIAGEDFPHFLGREWANGYRARRIRELLQGRASHTVESFASMQSDVISLAAADLRVHLLKAKPNLKAKPDLKAKPNAELEASALEILRAWDLRVSADSAGAAIYEVWRHHLLRAAFGGRLGDLRDYYLGQGIDSLVRSHSYHNRMTARLVSLLDCKATHLAAPDAWPDLDAALQESLSLAVAELVRRCGRNPSRWRWGSLHTVEFKHPLALGPLRRFLNLGGFGVGGDLDTVAQAAPDVAAPYAVTGPAASYRLIVDLADFDRSIASLATGESGHPGSRHYADQLPLWRQGKHHPLPFSRNAVLQSVAGRMRLLAATSTTESRVADAGSPRPTTNRIEA